MARGQKISFSLFLLGSIYLVVLSLLNINPKLQISLTCLVIPLGMIAGLVLPCSSKSVDIENLK